MTSYPIPLLTAREAYQRVAFQELSALAMALGADPVELAELRSARKQLIALCNRLEHDAEGAELEFSNAARNLCGCVLDVETEPESFALLAAATDTWDGAVKRWWVWERAERGRLVGRRAE